MIIRNSDKYEEIKGVLKVAKISDEELVSQYIQTRKESYFETIYDRYEKRIYAKCISMLKNEAKAQDATQDIFIKVLLNISKFVGKSRFSTWIYSITYNYCIDVIRKNNKDALVFPDQFHENIEATDDVDEKILLEIKINRLEAILEELPHTDKAVLIMKYQDEMSIKQIGQLFNKSDSAIKMQLKRSKIRFIKIFREKYKNDE